MEVDVGRWAVIGPEYGGRERDKSWMAAKSDAARSEHWLWKPRTTTDDGSVHALNDVAEVAASRIADLLHLPAAQCVYAYRKGERGVISRNVTPSGFDLHDGEVFLFEVEGYARRPPRFDDDGMEKGRVRSNLGYTLEAVESVLDGMSGPPGWDDLTAFQVFAGYLVLDALIANTDRHPRNWAILESRRDGRRAIAPTFDHGTGLGAGLSDVRRGGLDVASFCRRGFANPFSPPRQPLVTLARRAVTLANAAFWLERIRQLSVEGFAHALEAPSGRLSVVASTFIEQVLTINRERLCDADESQD